MTHWVLSIGPAIAHPRVTERGYVDCPTLFKRLALMCNTLYDLAASSETKVNLHHSRESGLPGFLPKKSLVEQHRLLFRTADGKGSLSETFFYAVQLSRKIEFQEVVIWKSHATPFNKHPKHLKLLSSTIHTSTQ